MPEIQQADPRARRNALIWGGLMVMVGVAAIVFVERGAIADRPWALGITAALSVAPLPGFAIYLWLLGRRTVRAERFPPPGTRVVQDTVVLVGVEARRRGRWLQVLALLMIASFVGMAAVTVRLFWLLSTRG